MSWIVGKASSSRGDTGDSKTRGRRCSMAGRSTAGTNALADASGTAPRNLYQSSAGLPWNSIVALTVLLPSAFIVNLGAGTRNASRDSDRSCGLLMGLLLL